MKREELELISKEELQSIIYFLYEMETMHIEALVGGNNLLGLSEEELMQGVFNIASDIVMAKEVYGDTI